MAKISFVQTVPKTSELRIIIRRWIAMHVCVRSHFRTCDVRAEMRAAKTSLPVVKISFF